MLLLPESGTLPRIGRSEKIAPDRPAGVRPEPKGLGFQAVLAKQGGPATDSAASVKGKPLPLATRGLVPTRGETLPLHQRSAGAAPTPERTALANLDGTLNRLTETVGQLLQREHDGDGPLSNWLSEQLGLDKAQVDNVLAALQSWVDQPPVVALDVNQLMEAAPEALAEVETFTVMLDELGQELSGWLAALDADVGSTVPSLPLSEQWLSKSSGQTPDRAASMVAQMLQTIQNSAGSGSLPISMDLSRPEAGLLLSQEILPAEKTAFNQALVAMARQALSDEPRNRESSAEAGGMLASLGAVETAPGGGAAATLAGESLLKAETLSLQRLERPMLVSDAGRQLGERIHMMVRGDIQHATIRLDPPELGMMDIRITVQNDQTQVQIVVQSPQVREALESQSTRLREFLEQQGLSLANLDVHDGSADRRDGDSEGQPGGADGVDDGDDIANESAVSHRSQGLVDHFV